MATASPVRTNGIAKSASFQASGMPDMAQVRDSGGIQADTDASSVASSGPGDNGDSRSSEQASQAVQILKEVEVVPSFLSSRSEEYRQLFRLPAEEGHMYLFVHYICFYANIFGFETKKIIPFNEVSSVQKAKTAGLFPNAIEIIANEKKYFFASFLSRDEAYRLIVDGWTHCCNNAKYVDSQEPRSEVSTPENKIDMFERLKSLTRPGGSSNSSVDWNKETAVEVPQDVISNEESNNQPINGKVMVVQESECIMKDGPAHDGSVPAGTLSWKPEDLDAPKIPEHYKLVAEAKFPICPEVFFKLFFSDGSADFCGTYHKGCGDKNFRCDPWYRHQQFGHVRNAFFQHPIKLYLGAKFAQCQETQKFRVYRNSHLVVLISEQMTDAPYSDYFTVEGK